MSKLTEFTRDFTKLNKNDAGIAGGKGASLGEMTQAGIPVPPGFVVLASAFDRFVAETDLAQEIDSTLHSVNNQEIHTVDDASEKIKALIMGEEIPADIASEISSKFKALNSKWVAVRSSATAEDSASAAWAGQLESYLNTTEENLLENVKRCWASLFTPRAIFYRFEKFGKETHLQKISVAVVIQKMVDSEKSGIAFSVHPVTQDYNQLIIEAGLGLGEAIVSGQITPDSYVVEKSPRRILDKNIVTQTRGLFKNGWRNVPKEHGEPPTLSDTQILELSDLVLRIESHYGFPCDIEWAFEGDKFYIVQSRPITTLGSKQSVKDDPMILLGAWNVMPLEAWRWFDTAGIDRLEKLTGVQVRVFTYVKDELHYQCVFEKETKELKQKFEQHKSEAAQIEYLNSIYTDFYKEVVKLEDYLDKVENKDVSRFSDIDLVEAIKKFADLWTAITMQVWYAVFLDIWYPLPGQHHTAKEIAAKARDRTGHLHERSNKTERRLYAEASKRLSLDVRDINYLFPAEIIDAIKNGVSYVDHIKERREFCVTTSMEGKYQIYSGKQAQELFETYQPPAEGTKAQNQLAGTPACRGKVKGTVRVIRRDSDFDEFQEGEILVALQTMIHYVPIMRKAKAILTEFGGLTSHAAIVSRELNKPCVVGIPNLLASVKDGDLVEMDADVGVVKILQTASAQNPQPRDYVRMFAGKAFAYILTEIFLGYYDCWGVLSIQDASGSWMSFLPKKSQEKTREDGKELYTSEKLYRQYRKDFADYVESSAKVFDSIIEKERLTEEDLKAFFDVASKHFSYYSKTEFFYTDLLDQSKMVLSVQEFDKLKLDGRAYLNKIIFEETGFVRRLFNKLSRQTGVPIPRLYNYGIEELIELVETGKKVGSKVIKDRNTFFASRDVTLIGNAAQGLVEKFLSSYRDISDMIKGTVANKGKARGKARVFVHDMSNFGRLAAEIDAMEQGEILVAETTAPEIIQACKKAAAIVTNQGGMLSHAAIVSRELGIPCVIGTDKDVILNIKTGDLLEVDADNGIIKILEKNNPA